jgi:DNA repair protein RadC
MKEDTMSTNIEALSDSELLGLVVGAGAAAHFLEEAGGSLGSLLSDVTGTGERCGWLQTRVAAAAEVMRRSLLQVLGTRDVLTAPSRVREYLQLTLAFRDREVFYGIFLDAQNRVIASEELFRGTLSQTSVYPREVVRRALALNAAAVIFAHNHPSGVAEPSHADEMLTRCLKSALALVDVAVLDHFVVAGACTLSFAERGLL